MYPLSWWRRTSQTTWVPAHKLVWACESENLRVVRYEARKEGPVLVCRGTYGERWASAPATENGVPVPTFAQCRETLQSRLETDFVETLNNRRLLPDSFSQMLRQAEEYRAAVIKGARPPQETFGFDGLVPQLAVYHSLLNLAEWYLDIKVFHTHFVKTLLCMKHICQVDAATIKALHTWLVGPAGTGKSYMMTSASSCMPDGTYENVVHLSAQNQFADLAHVEEIASRAIIMEEARHDMLGTQGRSARGGNAVKNSTDEVANENKDKMTKRRIATSVLAMSKEGGRKRRRIIVALEGSPQVSGREREHFFSFFS